MRLKKLEANLLDAYKLLNQLTILKDLTKLDDQIRVVISQDQLNAYYEMALDYIGFIEIAINDTMKDIDKLYIDHDQAALMMISEGGRND